MTLVGYPGNTRTRVGYEKTFVEYVRDTWAFEGHEMLLGYLWGTWTLGEYVATCNINEYLKCSEYLRNI